MASIGDLLGGIGIGNPFSGGGFMGVALILIVGTVVAFGLFFFFFWFFKKRRNYNIKVEFKLPRNIGSVRTKNGKIKIYGTLNKEWGKGFYDGKKGVVFVKRYRKKPVPMKPFDIKRYLSSGSILTVIQVGIEDYRPVLDDSYIEVIDDKTGEEAALIRAKIDTTEGKSWKNSYERERKNTYTLSNWLRDHGTLVATGLVIMMVLVGFAVLWTRIPKVCG